MADIEKNDDKLDKKEELNISIENQKLYEKLMQDLGFTTEKRKKSNSLDLYKSFQTISKLQKNISNPKEQ